MRKSKIIHTIFNPIFRLREKIRRKKETGWKEKNENFQKHAADRLRFFKACMDKNDLKFWLTAGTLLGAYREKRLLAHDIDIDVAMFISDMEKTKKVLLSEGFTLEHEFGIVGEGISEMSFCYEDIKIDIFYAKKMKDKLVTTIFFKDFDTDKNDDFRVIEMFLPNTDFIEYEFLGDKYLIPEKTKEYLTANYGPNFMKPDKYWNYTRDIPSAIYHTLESKRGFNIKH